MNIEIADTPPFLQEINQEINGTKGNNSEKPKTYQTPYGEWKPNPPDPQEKGYFSLIGQLAFYGGVSPEPRDREIEEEDVKATPVTKYNVFCVNGIKEPTVAFVIITQQTVISAPQGNQTSLSDEQQIGGFFLLKKVLDEEGNPVRLDQMKPNQKYRLILQQPEKFI